MVGGAGGSIQGMIDSLKYNKSILSKRKKFDKDNIRESQSNGEDFKPEYRQAIKTFRQEEKLREQQQIRRLLLIVVILSLTGLLILMVF